ncbi:MAG: TIM barrel protein [Anaerolineales bacterium]|nr:TIM barrel protein [Anaerolineales bacterium]
MTTKEKITVGAAPVSWGVYEANPQQGSNPPYEQVLGQIAAARYAGVELGPYGYLPTNPDALAGLLARYNLQLGSSYIAFPLDAPERVERRLPLLAELCALLSHFRVPFVMAAADATPEREAIAGSVPGDGSKGWNAAQWDEVRISMARICDVVQHYPGLRIAFHHEASSPVESPAEIERLLAVTDPEIVGLCFDTGHIVYGGGDPVELAQRLADRIWYVHLKDVWPNRLSNVRRNQLPAGEAWAMGVFAELGKGSARIPQVVERLLKNGYAGWIIVEQDIVASNVAPDAPARSAAESRAYLKREFGI